MKLTTLKASLSQVVKRRRKVRAWVPYGFRVKNANFSRLVCLAIPRRDLNTKKTKAKQKRTRKPRGYVRILIYRMWAIGNLSVKIPRLKQGSFLHEQARPLNKRCAWRLTTRSAFIKMAHLKAIIIAIIFLVGLG